MKRFSTLVVQKEGESESAGRKAPDLLEALRLAVNQRQFDLESCDMTAAGTKIKLIERCYGVAFSTTSIFEPITSVASSG
eukprot:2200854-Pleurochrysis_carterae.AAC.1